MKTNKKELGKEQNTKIESEKTENNKSIETDEKNSTTIEDKKTSLDDLSPKSKKFAKIYNAVRFLVIIAAGVALLVPLTPILNSPVLKPAFDNILPALFGGLAVVYVSKNWKISIAPLVFMVVLFLLVPSLSSSVGVLVPVGALIAIGAARILYKKGKL